jgi:site-specific recombinase XerC
MNGYKKLIKQYKKKILTEEEQKLVSRQNQILVSQIEVILAKQQKQGTSKRKVKKKGAIQCKFCEFIAKREQEIQIHVSQKYCD